MLLAFSYVLFRGDCGSLQQCVFTGVGEIVWSFAGHWRRGLQSQYLGCQQTKLHYGKTLSVICLLERIKCLTAIWCSVCLFCRVWRATPAQWSVSSSTVLKSVWWPVLSLALSGFGIWRLLKVSGLCCSFCTLVNTKSTIRNRGILLKPVKKMWSLCWSPKWGEGN